MRAVVLQNGALLVEERPDPVPGDTEVLVAVHAAGLNGADMLQRRGGYPSPPGVLADIPGLEVAGEVAAVGARVHGARVGDRVMALVAGGGQATMAVVDEAHLLPVPEHVPWPEAGGFPEVFTTAYDALFTRSGLAMGERVLVTGAAGGVGVAAVQLAAASGASVVASVRDPARREALATLGAAEVIGASDAEEVAAHGPYDVVLELVGAASLPAVLGALRTNARVAVVGVGSGSKVELDLLTLMRARATVGGSTLRARSRAEKSTIAAAMRSRVLPLLTSGRVRVPICDTYPIDEVVRAYDRFSAGAKLGKIVIETRA